MENINPVQIVTSVGVCVCPIMVGYFWWHPETLQIPWCFEKIPFFSPLISASSSACRIGSSELAPWLFPCSLLFPVLWLCLLGFFVGLLREMKVLIITVELKIASNSLAQDTKIGSLPAYPVKYSGNPSKVTSVKTSFWVCISFFQNLSLVSA